VKHKADLGKTDERRKGKSIGNGGEKPSREHNIKVPVGRGIMPLVFSWMESVDFKSSANRKQKRTRKPEKSVGGEIP